MDDIKILKLFTDGGGFRQEDKTYIGSSAFRILLDDEVIMKGTSISNPGTNQFAELRAMALGFHEVGKYIEDIPGDYIIEVYSDSEYSIKCLTQWIYNWKRKAKKGVYYSATKPPKPVTNQKIIDLAFDKLSVIKKKYQVSFFHLNSHIMKDELTLAHTTFKTKNPMKKNMSLDEFLFIRSHNEACDKMVKEAYTDYMVDNVNMKNHNTKNIDV